MKTIKLLVELTYDEDLMHGEDPESIRWFRDEILMCENREDLLLHSNEIGDTVGSIRVLQLPEEVERSEEFTAGKETDMGSMKGKQEKIDAAFGRIADMIPSGNLLASADPVGFLDTVAAELKDLRAENVKLKGTVSIKQDRVNDLEKALRDTLRQLERAINGNAMDGDWITAELHGRECLYSQA